EREAKQAVRHRHERRGIASDAPENCRMVGVESAGQRAERRHDDLARRCDEATARDLSAAEVNPKLRVIMARDLRAGLAALRLVAEHDAPKLNLILDAPAAMVGKAGIVVADNPGPVEAGREGGQQGSCARIQPVAAKAVVEAVAETVEPRRTGAL